jgi:hypothetical protein
MPFLSYWALRICFLTHLILCPSFLSVLSCLFRFCHSVGIAISFQKIFSLCSAQGLLSCSVFSYFPVCHLLSVPTLLSCRITPVLPFLSLIFLNNFYTPLDCHYCLPSILLKGSSYF